MVSVILHRLHLGDTTQQLKNTDLGELEKVYKDGFW